MIVAGTTGEGSLTLDATKLLTDFVPSTATTNTNSVLVNFWKVTGGFSLPVKPAFGDLFGTEIHTVAAGNQQSKLKGGEDPLLRCIMAGLIDPLCKRREQGTLECELTEGRSGTLVRESVVPKFPSFCRVQHPRSLWPDGQPHLAGPGDRGQRAMDRGNVPRRITVAWSICLIARTRGSALEVGSLP